jgi:signal transduction histidine kinase
MVQDGVIAALLTVAALFGVRWHLEVDLLDSEANAFRHIDMLGVGLILCQTAPVTWRRKAPIPTLIACSAAVVAYSTLHYRPSLASFGFLVALFTVAAEYDRRTSVPVGLGSALLVLAMLAVIRQRIAPDTISADALIVGATWFLGDGIRIRRIHLAQLEDRATRLENEREEQARKAVIAERQVIARELHDVVAHHVSIMAALAGGAQRVFQVQPDESLHALRNIEAMGREALVEMRRMTGFLRTDDNPDALAPQPGLRELDALLAQVREAGVPVTVRIEGEPRPLPVGLDLSAFRIVQEALTNVLKHAGPARAEVQITFEADRLELAVRDDGRGRTGGEKGGLPGYGQVGMRERVALFGGELRVGPRPGGGYETVARLPLGTEPS